MGKRLFLVILSCLVGFVGMELGYRWYKWQQYGLIDYPDVLTLGHFRLDPQFGYVAVKNFSSDSIPLKIREHPRLARHFGAPFHTNSWGYRGSEFSANKDPGTFRVVTLGGSTTMCMEVGDADTWPAQLQRRLNADAAFLHRLGAERVEVINAANGGWRSRELLLRLSQEVRRIEPDLILVDVNWNDAALGTDGHDPDRAFVARHPWWNQLKLFQNLRIRYLQLLDRSPGHMDRARSRLKRDSRWAAVLERNLRQMDRLASEFGSRMVLVNLPGLCRRQAPDSLEFQQVVAQTRTTRENYPYWVQTKELMTGLMREVGQELGIQIIHVDRHFNAFAGEERLGFFVDEVHVNEKGAEEVARVIHRALSSKGEPV